MKTQLFSIFLLLVSVTSYSQTSYNGIFTGAFNYGPYQSFYHDTTDLTVDKLPVPTSNEYANIIPFGLSADSVQIEIFKKNHDIIESFCKIQFPRNLKNGSKFIYVDNSGANTGIFVNLSIVSEEQDSLRALINVTRMYPIVVPNENGPGHHTETGFTNAIGTLNFAFHMSDVLDNRISTKEDIKLTAFSTSFPRQVHFRLDKNSVKSNILDYSIFSISGSKILQGNLTSHSTNDILSIPMPNLSSGIYFLKVADKERSYFGKFIVN